MKRLGLISAITVLVLTEGMAASNMKIYAGIKFGDSFDNYKNLEVIKGLSDARAYEYLGFKGRVYSSKNDDKIEEIVLNKKANSKEELTMVKENFDTKYTLEKKEEIPAIGGGCKHTIYAYNDNGVKIIFDEDSCMNVQIRYTSKTKAEEMALEQQQLSKR